VEDGLAICFDDGVMAIKRESAPVVDPTPRKSLRVQARSTRVRLVVEEGPGQLRLASETEVLQVARSLLKRRLRRGRPLPDPQAVQHYLQFTIGTLDHEVFFILLLDGQQRLIAEKVLFRGTATQTAVYPREVVKEALAVNACSVILAHNHPSRSSQPSSSDRALTQTLKSALALVDIEVLDHILVTDQGTVSMAALGMV
jgi:DNA repair protein RadC